MALNRRRSIAVVLAMLMVASVALPGAVAAQTDTLSIDVDQDHATGEAIVTVTDNGTAVANASVLVESDENYSAEGTYNTSENGTVTLENPNTTVNVTITATTDNVTTSTNVTLVPLSESVALDLTLEDDGSAKGTLTQYGDPVDNATVTVSVDGNESYAGAGEYTTDENGTFRIPAADDEVTVVAEATVNGIDASDTVTLPGQTLTVDAHVENESLLIGVALGGEPVDGANVGVETTNGTYAYTGEYVTDNGTVSLPAPTENVTLSIEAEYDGESASTTFTYTANVTEEPEPNDFAKELLTFIRFLQAHGYDGPLGQHVSEFVHANNPSENDDDRGPPEHAQGNDDENETEHGPPAWANGHEEDERHSDDVESEEQDRDEYRNQTMNQTAQEDGEPEEPEEDGDDDEDGDDEDERGPPEHAPANGQDEEKDGDE